MIIAVTVGILLHSATSTHRNPLVLLSSRLLWLSSLSFVLLDCHGLSTSRSTSSIKRSKVQVSSTRSSSSSSRSSSSSSSSSTKSTMPQELIPSLDSLATTASSFASVHGILVERRQTDFDESQDKQKLTSYFECAPISLLPNAFPRACFERALHVAPLFNQMVDVTSQNPDFLKVTLQQVTETDFFTAQLFQMYQEIYCGPEPNFAKQADRLGLLRSDYMLNQGSIKQVELNTIASSFGALSTRVSALHRHLTTTTLNNPAVQKFLLNNKRIVLATDEVELAPEDGVPDNHALENLAEALHLAAHNYQARFCTESSIKPVILFVVQPGETNTVDQRLLEFQVTQAHGWRVLRKSLTELATQAKIDTATGALMLHTADDQQPPEQIAVVYYRAGYAPTDYFGSSEWNARRILEESIATKSPCLGYHLVGTKKVQQALARPGALEKLLGEDLKHAVEPLRDVFAGLYSLGNDMMPGDYQVLTDILKHDKKGQYVLKPQREGGGYNFYGQNMKDKLLRHVTLSEEENAIPVVDKILSEYILMQRLFPPEQPAILLRSGQVEGSGPSISELGCFGTILCGPDGKVLHNKYAGFLLRTKFSHVDEGGVAAGFATLSSPYLV